MSARNVADMLALAYAGYAQAVASGDEPLRASSAILASLALAHPDAGTFFAGLQMALADTHGDQPIENDDAPLPSNDALEDGTLDAASPVDAGALPHDGHATGIDEAIGDGDDGEHLESAALVVRRSANVSDTMMMVLANLSRPGSMK